SVSDDFASLLLSVVQTVAAHFVKTRITFTFDSKSLIVRQMPVEHVELDRSHRVEVSLEHLDRLKMTSYVDKQPPPRKARFVLYAYRWNEVSLCVTLEELQKGLQPSQRSNNSRGFKHGRAIGHIQ